MIQEPKNYHAITEFADIKRVFDEGNTFVAFDTETTGLSAQRERIIEIGAVKFDRSGEIARFGTLLDPERPIPAKITEITGITDDMVREMPTAKAAVPDFLEFSKGCVVVAHNAPFDLQFLNWELIRLGLDTLQNRTVDTLRLSRAVFPRLKCWKQPFLAETLSIPVREAHRAWDDARVCMEIFVKMVGEPA